MVITDKTEKGTRVSVGQLALVAHVLCEELTDIISYGCIESLIFIGSVLICSLVRSDVVCVCVLCVWFYYGSSQ